MNALYEESDDLFWDLRCSAQYNDDFVQYLQHTNPEALSSPTCVFKDPESMVPCHKPSVPRQCPHTHASYRSLLCHLPVDTVGERKVYDKGPWIQDL